jgi:transcriptional regulator with XRE-family HTH domain
MPFAEKLAKLRKNKGFTQQELAQRAGIGIAQMRRYDREMKDIFALQDEIAMKIPTALEVNLSEGEQAVMMVKGTRNLAAYLKVLQSTFYRRRLNVEDNVKARRLANDPQGGTNHPKSLFADFNFDLTFIDKIVKCRLLDWIPAYAGRTSMVSI